jgi:hypothetical protein
MWRVIRIDRSPFARRVGRRGLILIIGGLAWIAVGVTVIQTAPLSDRFTSPDAEPQTLDLFERPWTGVVWTGCGAVAVLVGALHDRTIAAQHDAVGFNAFLIPPMMWMFCYVWSVLAYWSTGGLSGSDSGVYGLTVWTLVSLVIIIIAGWPDPSDDARPGPPPRR